MSLTSIVADRDLSSTHQEYRVEPIPKPGFPHEKYPRWIGHKFEPDGNVLPFPGHTVICHLPAQSPLYQALLPLYDMLKSQDFNSLYVLLPPTSWHMTVFEGVSDQIRKRGSWPGDLPLDAPLSTCIAQVGRKLANFNTGSEKPFEMTNVGWEPLEDGIALKVVPAAPEEERRLRRLRDRIAEHLLMRHPGHSDYSFHVSMAYMLRRPDQQEARKLRVFLKSCHASLPTNFELGAPEFCTFDDMFAFRQEFLLGQQSASNSK